MNIYQSVWASFFIFLLDQFKRVTQKKRRSVAPQHTNKPFACQKHVLKHLWTTIPVKFQKKFPKNKNYNYLSIYIQQIFFWTGIPGIEISLNTVPLFNRFRIEFDCQVCQLMNIAELVFAANSLGSQNIIKTYFCSLKYFPKKWQWCWISWFLK